MNKAVEFFESVIDYPEETLGVGRFAVLDLAADYLAETKGKKLLPLLRKTIDELYAELTPEVLLKHNANNPIYSLLSKLQKSHWRQEAMERMVEIYLKNFSRSNPLDGLIEAWLYAIEDESKFFVTEKLTDEFDIDVDSCNQYEQFLYCLHVLNACFLLQTKNFKFDHLKFGAYTKHNLLRLLHQNNAAFKRIVVWAMFWFNNAAEGQSKLPLFNVDELAMFYKTLAQNIDYKTNLRISVMLIKSSDALFNKLNKELVSEWAENILEKKTGGVPSTSEAFGYDDLVQKRLLEVLAWENIYLRDEIVIPYLGLMADKETIGELYKYLEFNDARKISAAIILSGLKLLTNEQIERYDIEDSKIFDRIIGLNIDRCFRVFGRDSTKKTAWYCILVAEDKKEDFLKRKPGENYDLADYGRVISSGYGETVPDDIKALLKEKYNFDNL